MMIMAVLLVLTACGPQYSGNNKSSDFLSGVIGGQEVKADDPLAKSVVVIYDTQKKMICTGSIVSPKHVITAAHCIDPTNIQNLLIIYGTNISDHNLIMASGHVAAAIQYQGWQPKLGKKIDTGDIALLRLSSVLPEGFLPGQFLRDPTVLQAGVDVLIAGYGITTGTRSIATKDDDGVGILRSATTKILNPKFSQTEVLVDEGQGKGTCHGDSGGPAYVKVGDKNLLFGLTSRGTDDHCSATVIYTNILSYFSWFPKADQELEARVLSSTTSSLPLVGSIH